MKNKNKNEKNVRNKNDTFAFIYSSIGNMSKLFLTEKC